MKMMAKMSVRTRNLGGHVHAKGEAHAPGQGDNQLAPISLRGLDVGGNADQLRNRGPIDQLPETFTLTSRKKVPENSARISLVSEFSIRIRSVISLLSRSIWAGNVNKME